MILFCFLYTICWNLREVRQVKQLISRKISQRQRPQSFAAAIRQILLTLTVEYLYSIRLSSNKCLSESILANCAPSILSTRSWYLLILYSINISILFIKKSTETGRTNFFPYFPSKFPWHSHESHLHRLIPPLRPDTHSKIPPQGCWDGCFLWLLWGEPLQRSTSWLICNTLRFWRKP